MKKTTTDHLAISTVELMAIIAALYWIEESGTKKVIICSDSSSALVSISRYHQRTGRFAYMKYMNNIKIVQNNIIKEWQYTWDREVTGRHYHIIQKKECRRVCKGIITRLRMGHTGLNKTSHLIGKHPTGLCDHCQEEE